MFLSATFNRILLVMALGGGTVLAQSQPPKQEELPAGLRLRIAMLIVLSHVNSDMLAAYAKAYSSESQDLVTAGIVRAIREKSAQSAADFAAAAGIDVEQLQTAEREGTGLDETALAKIWGMGLLSVEELSELRRDIVVGTLSEEEKALLAGPAQAAVLNLLQVLQYTQILTRHSRKSAQLPAAEDILHKMRDDYNVLRQLAAEHFPQTKQFIALESFSDELVAAVAKANEAQVQLRHHVAFMFFLNVIREAREQQQKVKAAE